MLLGDTVSGSLKDGGVAPASVVVGGAWPMAAQYSAANTCSVKRRMAVQKTDRDASARLWVAF